LEQDMKIAAAALVLLTSSVAAAFPRANFRVGAYVVASATVSASMSASAQRRVEIRASAGRAPAPTVVVGGQMKRMSDPAAQFTAPPTGDVQVTILY
jgi:hypothetical protein